MKFVFTAKNHFYYKLTHITRVFVRLVKGSDIISTIDSDINPVYKIDYIEDTKDRLEKMQAVEIFIVSSFKSMHVIEFMEYMFYINGFETRQVNKIKELKAKWYQFVWQKISLYKKSNNVNYGTYSHYYFYYNPVDYAYYLVNKLNMHYVNTDLLMSTLVSNYYEKLWNLSQMNTALNIILLYNFSHYSLRKNIYSIIHALFCFILSNYWIKKHIDYNKVILFYEHLEKNEKIYINNNVVQDNTVLELRNFIRLLPSYMEKDFSYTLDRFQEMLDSFM